MPPRAEIKYSSGTPLSTVEVKVPRKKAIMVVVLPGGIIKVTSFDEQDNTKQLIELDQDALRRTLRSLLPGVQKSGDIGFDREMGYSLINMADVVSSRSPVDTIRLFLDPLTEGEVEGSTFSLVNQQALNAIAVIIAGGLSLNKDGKGKREVEELCWMMKTAGFRLTSDPHTGRNPWTSGQETRFTPKIKEE